MDSTLYYDLDDLFFPQGEDVVDLMYPELPDSPKPTHQPTLTLPEAPQKPTTPVQQEPFIFSSNTPTDSYNTAQQIWDPSNLYSYYGSYGQAPMAIPPYQPPATYEGYSTPNYQALPAQTRDLTALQNQLIASDSLKGSRPRTLSQKLLQGKMIIHSRNQRHKNEDPAAVYEKSPAVQPWGPLLKNTRVPEHTFEYCKSYVELTPLKRFTKDELIMFMKGSGCPNPQRKLTLWIQNTPSEVNNRYVMASSSGKCRYKHCPGKFTIQKGFMRVAFDEYSDKTGISLDPFHNAGYMHLHCFEKLFDLAYLTQYGAAQHGFVIRPDERNFPMESRNPMSMARDHHQMIVAYHEWLRQQKQRCDMLYYHQGGHYGGFHIPSPPSHQKTLGYKLTMCHLSREIVGRVATCEKRGGANIGIHKGNLEHFMHLKAKMKNPSRNFNKRRSRDDDEEKDEEDEEDEEDEQKQQQEVTITYKSRPTKRARAPRVPSINTSLNTSITNPILVDDADFLSDYNPLKFMDFQAEGTSYPTTNQQVIVPSQLSPALQSPAGPRTRQKSREMSISLVGFLNSRNHLTRTQAQDIGARLADGPSHVQDSVLSAVQSEVTNILLRDGISPVVESKIKRLNKRQLKDLETVVERVEKNGDMRRVSSMW
ncbi:hypothetical protein QBC36DRAFT_385451 [Triangularia setosa]|uniref:Uncharacterized protein n=1 Tax=Triangularia setosa TaxID=2587417 RepID=A0AAN6WCJ2_9PEZI|nr:hypothetical protein QBC36DRAFT_385451 [Podospora setosa]